jgi:hypothetical protein
MHPSGAVLEQNRARGKSKSHTAGVCYSNRPRGSPSAEYMTSHSICRAQFSPRRIFGQATYQTLVFPTVMLTLSTIARILQRPNVEEIDKVVFPAIARIQISPLGLIAFSRLDRCAQRSNAYGFESGGVICCFSPFRFRFSNCASPILFKPTVADDFKLAGGNRPKRMWSIFVHNPDIEPRATVFCTGIFDVQRNRPLSP